MTIRDRRQGWLDDRFHARFRELLLHSLFRHGCACPVYCLMPDHMHLLILGWSETADQQLLMRFLRRHVNAALEPDFRLQKQPHDNVIKEEDRERDALERVVWYLADNPVRGGLVEDQAEYPFTNCMIPGYPELDFWKDDYWDRFWRIYASKLP